MPLLLAGVLVLFAIARAATVGMAPQTQLWVNLAVFGLCLAAAAMYGLKGVLKYRALRRAQRARAAAFQRFFESTQA